MTTVAILVLAVLSQQGAAQVSFPIEGGKPEQAKDALSKIQLEAYVCPKGCDKGDEINLEKCKCGETLTRVETPSEFRPTVTVEDSTVTLSYTGTFKGCLLLRQAAVDAALREAGLRRREQGAALQGMLQIHVDALKDKDAVIEKLKKVEGIRSAAASDTLIHVNADKASLEAVKQALGETAIKDISWVVNMREGRMGYVIQ